MKLNCKLKLKRRGIKLYNKYFFNPEHIIELIIKQYDTTGEIDSSICEVVFDTELTTKEQIYELIMYYPNKLKEKKIITDNFVKELYNIYGTTINIMKKTNGINVRGKMFASAKKRAKEKNLCININSEDIILVETCKYFKEPLIYGNSKAVKFSASIDRIDSTKGYEKDNIQIISFIANSMKSNASNEELIIFSKAILGIE
jgi:uncharacterized protein YlxP (DUF503 family)